MRHNRNTSLRRFDDFLIPESEDAAPVEVTQDGSEAGQGSTDRLRLLICTSNATLLHTEPEKLLSEIFALLSAYCGLEVCFSYWVNGNRLKLAYSTGVDRETMRQLEWLDYGQAVCGTVALRHQRIVAENIQNSPNSLTELVRSLGIQAYVCHPLLARGRFLGTLSYGTRQRPVFSDEEISVMQAVSDQVALAIDRMLMIRDLEQQNCELRQANCDLEQFAYSAAHDLKEPLRNIAICSGLLVRKSGKLLDSPSQEYLAQLIQNARRMDSLLDDLLAYTQIGKADTSSSLEQTEASEVLKNVLNSFSSTITELGAEITFSSLPSHLNIRRIHLEQLFQNLISNALKYRSNQPPRINITAQITQEGWLFSVADNGIGIPPEYQERIFGIFKRLHTADQYSGTGIGLAICKRIVERYHGRIWVESGPGKGSTFHFNLPA
jgi:signal transduction histidine kinase